MTAIGIGAAAGYAKADYAVRSFGELLDIGLLLKSE
jgi:hypothetical protein